MDNALELADGFEQMNKVVSEFIKGNNVNAIAKQFDLKPVQVSNMLNTWRELMHGDNGIRERAKEALGAADQHYSMVIQEAWKTVKQADDQDALNVKSQALKLIADVESKRIDMLQKAGVIEKNEMSDQILETERKQEVLVGILRDVTSSCPNCKQEVARRLSSVTNKVEVISVD
jgi:transposase-like protein